MGKFFALICTTSLLLGGCVGGVDYFRLAQSGVEAGKAATVSEKDLVQSSSLLRTQMDATNQTAPDNSAYEKKAEKSHGK